MTMNGPGLESSRFAGPHLVFFPGSPSAKLLLSDCLLDDNLAHIKRPRPRPQIDKPNAQKPGVFHDIGALTSLPKEMLVKVLLELDILSLTTFQQVNQSAAEFVRTLPRLSAIRRLCPEVLTAITVVRADSFSCNTLYNTLTATSGCSTCGRSGDHLYIITCKRICYECFTAHDDYCPLPPMTAARMAGLSFEMAKKQLPYIFACPGLYERKGHSARLQKSIMLFDRQAVLRARMLRPRTTTPNPAFGKPILRTNKRCMAVITIPHLGRRPSTETVDWGFYCTICASDNGLLPSFLPPRSHHTGQTPEDHIVQHHPGADLRVFLECISYSFSCEEELRRPWIIDERRSR